MEDTYRSSSNDRQLARTAVAIAAAAILLCGVAGWLAYSSSRAAIMGSVAKDSLSVAETIVGQVEYDVDQELLDTDRQRIFDDVAEIWNRTSFPYPGSYVCVIERPGRLALHTSKPEMIGTDVSKVKVDPHASVPRSVMELLNAKDNLATQNINFRGKDQLAGYAYLPSTDSFVVVHVPAKLVQDNILNSAIPWMIALGLIGFLLLPLSIVLLHRGYSRARSVAQNASKDNKAIQRRIEKQFAELELLYRTAPVGLCLMDVDLKFVRINDEMADINGLPADQHPGLSLRQVLPEIADVLEPIHRRVIQTGEPELDLEIDRPNAADPNNEHSYLVSYFPLKADGLVVGVSTVVQDITIRKQTERELLSRDQAVYKSITPTLFGDDQSRVTSANQAFLDLFGFESEAQVVGLPCNQFICLSTGNAHVEAELMEKGSWIGESTFTRDDGSTFDVVLRATVVRDESGNLVAFTTTFWDVTERKTAEAQLRLTQFAVDRSAFPIFWIRRDSTFFYVNEAATNLFGYSQDELLSMNVSDIDAAYPPEAWLSYWEAIQNQRTMTFDSKIFHKDGTQIDVEILTNLLDVNGQEFVIAYVADITARKKAEEQLVASETRFRALIENSFDVTNMFSAEGELIYTSPSIERVLGYAPDEMKKIHPMELIHPDDAENANKQFMACAEKPNSVAHLIHRIMHKDGSYRTVEITGTNLLNAPGIHAMVSVFRDITDSTVAKERLRERELQLAHVSRLSTMGEMAAGIAHEIKQPLHAIANFATASLVALRDPLSESKVQGESVKDLIEWNTGITSSSQRASQIVERLRSFSRKTDQQREAVSVAILFRESVDLVKCDTSLKQIIVETDLSEDLPMVMCDRIQVQQVLVNLLNNACDALTNVKDRERRIVFSAIQHRDQLELLLSDNGTGVDTEQSGIIFDAFYTSKHNGMGMGLAISRTIVEDLGGRLWVDTNSFGGATFHFTLPVVVEHYQRATENANVG